ncbi:hypothetical protein BHQ18_23050 [Mycolicibacterium flavescens]|uniref:Uncharacterized protein n=1 Tax=Mycolicibacterium flavescens TaxID=1776 RepID=A0A1E3RCT3_MYCFV|nr:hypothetical protein BHQ18_23050 [Mycolicibacterium flavescens]
MNCNSAFTGVAVAGMSRTLRVAARAAHPAPVAAHIAAAAYPAHAAAAVNPQRKRRTAAATVTSVDRGFI